MQSTQQAMIGRWKTVSQAHSSSMVPWYSPNGLGRRLVDGGLIRQTLTQKGFAEGAVPLHFVHALLHKNAGPD